MHGETSLWEKHVRVLIGFGYKHMHYSQVLHIIDRFLAAFITGALTLCLMHETSTSRSQVAVTVHLTTDSHKVPESLMMSAPYGPEIEPPAFRLTGYGFRI